MLLRAVGLQSVKDAMHCIYVYVYIYIYHVIVQGVFAFTIEALATRLAWLVIAGLFEAIAGPCPKLSGAAADWQRHNPGSSCSCRAHKCIMASLQGPNVRPPQLCVLV